MSRAPSLDVELIAELTAELEAVATAERAIKEKAYLKSDIEHLGVTMPAMRKVAKVFAKAHPMDPNARMAFCHGLWDEGLFELRTVAVELLTFRARELEPSDLPRVEALLRQSRTWALVDPLSIAVVGTMVERHPVMGDELDRWAEDEDFWIRRSAMLALLRPLRKGGGDWDRFLRYADAMLDEKEFFIRKAIGWVLREAGKHRADEIDAWLAPRTHRASGVTMREAVKKLPKRRADALMAAYRAGEPLVGGEAVR
ncbi:MAG: DNA alkylation repair protein [Polyangiaceae bacterium]